MSGTDDDEFDRADTDSSDSSHDLSARLPHHEPRVPPDLCHVRLRCSHVFSQ